jgi:hypothetical protein
MRIERTRPVTGAAPTRPATTTQGFADLLAPAAAPAAGTEAPSAAAVARAMGLPLDYDTAREAVLADRRARRHGKAMLQALGALQLALLAGPQARARNTLAELAAGMPEADDPVLRLILREIAARAATELARYGAQANISIS